MASGRVISLDLGGFEDLDLKIRRLDPALFNLTSLRNLSLAFIDLSYALLPASGGFDRLKDIIHLNLSYTSFMDQVPIEYCGLTSLVTLDLSGNYELYFSRPGFQTIMSNMSNLRVLYLDGVDLSRTGSTWSTVLAESVPQLQIFSLSDCDITGSFHPSFSRLRLTKLDISENNCEGQFPTEILQLKSLRTLDLSYNPMLSVRLTYFHAGNHLETLNLFGINFSHDMPLPSSFSNLESLKTLGLTTMANDNQLPSLIYKLPSLDVLGLMGGSDWKNLVLSWVGNLTQLTILVLDGYDFSNKLAPTWIGKLKSLQGLLISGCNFSVSIPYQIGNLTTLTGLDFWDCDFSEQRMPSWIGNLTRLTYLEIFSCNLSGPIPSTIGNLIQLEELIFWSTNIRGKIPKPLFALPVLQVLLIEIQLVGSLEDIPSPLSSPLREIDFNGNQLTGPIPKSFFQLKNLTHLNLNSNKLTGIIELGPIWRLENLIYINLCYNKISLIEKESDALVSPWPKIKYLHLASCNLTKVSATFKYLETIQALDLSNNMIKGAIPSWLWKSSLVTLNLSHNKFTTLEKSPLIKMPFLEFLDLSFNRLQGRILIPFSSDLFGLDYSNNNFSSIEPNFGRYLRNVIYINLSKNKLSVFIPHSICSLNNTEIMDLSYNYFSGPVPSCLVERDDLIVLKLRENKLHFLDNG